MLSNLNVLSLSQNLTLRYKLIVAFEGEEPRIYTDGAGDDVIYGDSDLISHDNEWTVTLSNGTLTVDGVDGVIHEDEGDTDYIDAGSGNDFVIAQDGEDIVFGGLGDDELQGGRDNDANLQLGSGLDYSGYKKNYYSSDYMTKVCGQKYQGEPG